MINLIGEIKDLVEKHFQIVLKLQFLMLMMILDINRMVKCNQQS